MPLLLRSRSQEPKTANPRRCCVPCRIAAPIPKRPRISISQVDGSGTGVTGSVGVPPPPPPPPPLPPPPGVPSAANTGVPEPGKAGASDANVGAGEAIAASTGAIAGASPGWKESPDEPAVLAGGDPTICLAATDGTFPSLTIRRILLPGARLARLRETTSSGASL